MSSMSSDALQGLAILNTRPSHQQTELNALLQADGALVISFPAIEITSIEPTGFHRNLNENIQQYDLAVFVSRNAVDGAFQFLQGSLLPADLVLAVIGQGTHKALVDSLHGANREIVYGDPYNSEGLLSTQALQHMRGRRVLIFRGQEGRTLLSDTLQQRGASVDHCEVYRRRLPDYAATDFQEACEHGFPSLVIFTSSEGMQNLVDFLAADDRKKLLSLPWLLISERMRESAVNLGHNADIIIAHKASDAGIHQAILDWAQTL